MMKFCQIFLLFMLCQSAVYPAQSELHFASKPVGGDFQVLCYHDVRDDLLEQPDRFTVTTAQLVQHFSWLKGNGYHVVSVDEIIAARQGGKPLPDKAILITFDDGYKSFRTRVFPLLKAFNYPAVLALVGSWLDAPAGENISYDGEPYPRESFLSWDEIRELAASGLVEIASHSYELHQGVIANPQGNTFPAMVGRLYSEQGYETEEAYQQRIRSDLFRNSDFLEKNVGKRPRVMVWPYGRFNETAVQAARDAGMPIALTLSDGLNTPAVSLDRIRRFLVSYDLTNARLESYLRPPTRPEITRLMHIDLDYVYDPDPEQMEANLSLLLDRVKEMGVNTVYLQAYADPDGNGAADALYFPNRHLPVRADIFSRVAWQLQTRANVRVFAWMPLLAFELPAEHPDRERKVQTLSPGETGYPRLSPFDGKARRVITEIYEDLSRSVIFQGILFHDDATLSDYEDASPAALHHYVTQWELPDSVEQIRADPEHIKRWTKQKTRHLTEFTQTLAKVIAHNQPYLKTARNLYARVVLEPESETWFAQSFPDFLENYDVTAIMAMPLMENAPEPMVWLRELVEKVAAHPGALKRSVFELQAVDWREQNRPLPGVVMARKMQFLQTSGAVNFGYYPDNFHEDQPPMHEIRPFISLQDFPYKDGKGQ